MPTDCGRCGGDLGDSGDYHRRLCEACLFDALESCEVCGHPERAHDLDGFDCETCIEHGGDCA